MNNNFRPLYEVAAEISKNWKPVNYAAKPYLEAMFSLDKVSDNYGADSGKSVVLYFLSNAGEFRGAVAKRVKAELKSMVAAKMESARRTPIDTDPEKKFYDGYATYQERDSDNGSDY